MSRFARVFPFLLAVCLLDRVAWADPIDLISGAMRIDGTNYFFGLNPLPAYVNSSGFNFSTGLGTISVNLGALGAGSHSVLVYFDHDLDLNGNGSFNEQAMTFGALMAGQSWQIGNQNSFAPGNVYDDAVGNTPDMLNNSIQYVSVDSLGNETPGSPRSVSDPLGPCCDIAMAMGFHFLLAPGQGGTLTFNLGTTMPAGLFFLHQSDVDDPSAQVYMSGKVALGPAVPEPSSLVLMGTGIAAVAVVRRRSWKRDRG